MAQGVGFDRPEMYQSPLVGTVSFHHKHAFVCYKRASSWPSQVESGELGEVTNSLFAAFKARKKDMGNKVRLTICEQGPGSCEGDVLVFPDMLRYRGLSASEAEMFVEEVMVKGNNKWKRAEQLSGNHVFVCAHGSRDARCGSCGPVLIESFRGEIGRQRLDGKVSVRACSHIGGHKFAGNVIIFGGTPVTGHWYGYVTPADVPTLLEQHIRKGQVVERLWRGQMSLTEHEQKQRQMVRVGENTCPCGMSQGECGNKQMIKANSSSKQVMIKQAAAAGANMKVQAGRGGGVGLRWLLAKRKWSKHDKVAAGMFALGCATAMAICYYSLSKPGQNSV